LPKDKVLELSTNLLGVQDLLNLKLFLAFNFDYSWGFLDDIMGLGFHDRAQARKHGKHCGF
jgi:hypothetical protein